MSSSVVQFSAPWTWPEPFPNESVIVYFVWSDFAQSVWSLKLRVPFCSFQNTKKHDFLHFFELLHIFSNPTWDHLPSHMRWWSPSCSSPLYQSSHPEKCSYTIEETVTSVDFSASLSSGCCYHSRLSCQQVLHRPSRGRCLLFSVQQTGTGCRDGSRSAHSTAETQKLYMLGWLGD